MTSGRLEREREIQQKTQDQLEIQQLQLQEKETEWVAKVKQQETSADLFNSDVILQCPETAMWTTSIIAQKPCALTSLE